MTEHAVVIAGAGPTGLMLAGELALAGVDVVIVEKRPDQELAGTRAGGISARTLEILDQRGHRGPLPCGGPEGAGHGVRRDAARHQRLSHAPQLRAGTAAEAHRAHPGRLGRRARGAHPLRAAK